MKQDRKEPRKRAARSNTTQGMRLSEVEDPGSVVGGTSLPFPGGVFFGLGDNHNHNVARRRR